MNTTSIGRQAESVAAEYLTKNGYTVLHQNWRTKSCEIDVIGRKDDTVYFVEVKFRNTAAWGDGMDAISPKKLRQMSMAAETWVQTNQWSGPYMLMAISLEGSPPLVTDCLELS